jgi:hypothetical protein
MIPSINKDWFTGKLSANNFGWDPLTLKNSDANIWPRIHLGDDFSPKDGRVFENPILTIISGRVEWIDADDQGNSVLRQFAGDIEIRYYHLRKAELSRAVKDALENHTPLEAGTVIGPCGDVGLGHGRHIHVAIVAADGTDLSAILGQGWDEDRTDDLAARYGKVFLEKAHAPNRRIIKMNDLMIYRIDGMTCKKVYYINPELLVG